MGHDVNGATVRSAAARVLRCYEHSAARGENLCAPLFAGEPTIEPYRHYGSVDDVATGARYFYHAHPPSARIRGEHGHFHVFLRPGRDEPGGPRLVQLVSISVNARGLPVALFTTPSNWAPSARAAALLPRFAVRSGGPRRIHTWLRAMLRAFRGDIVALLEARDRRLERWCRRHPSLDPRTNPDGYRRAGGPRFLSGRRISLDDVVRRSRA
ncbi:MAG TPA: hypothetical protein VFS43_15465 [Polyangiaceae bacterium]|nr:hypothetical protein [Polyangiaceae bacterium]